MQSGPANPFRILSLVVLGALPGVMCWNPAVAYPVYRNSGVEGASNCALCHPGFMGGRSDTLHALHTGGSDPVTGRCTFCHRSPGDLPIVMYSGDGLGCMGCHGRDYGETISDDYEGESTLGQPKFSGVGLRAHHAAAGINLCGGCHSGDPDPYPENVIDPGLGGPVHYYLRADSKGDPLASLGGEPVDPSSNEDSANDADLTGLDNDGDDLYDMADSDSVQDPGGLMAELMATAGPRLTWPTPSPGWTLQSSSTLGNDWVVLPAPDFRDRARGFWIVDRSLPVVSGDFYRLSNSAPAAAKDPVSDRKPPAEDQPGH
jgi:hypothetical protein